MLRRVKGQDPPRHSYQAVISIELYAPLSRLFMAMSKVSFSKTAALLD